MSRNDLYSNSSRSSRNGGGTWTYINGELYHFGRPGMQWGKHLPGTDWWKETYARNLANTNYTNARGNTTLRKIGAGLRTAKLAFNINKGKIKDALGYEISSAAKRGSRAVRNAYGKVKTGVSNAYTAAKNGTSRLYNAAKGYSQEKIAAMKESARTHYQKVKTNVHGILDKQYGKVSEIYNNPYLLLDKKGDSTNYLTKYVMKAAGNSFGNYSKATANGPLGKMFGSLLETGGVRALAAASKVLDRFGLDDEVDKLLNKMGIKIED